jgi:uncharacterized membrane protein YdcZ (DUF606 family)
MHRGARVDIRNLIASMVDDRFVFAKLAVEQLNVSKMVAIKLILLGGGTAKIALHRRSFKRS